ncbi:hypothetical protein ES705_11333 [subsurface metagenome]
MKKPIVRQLKKVKGSKGLVVCVPPEISDAIGSTEGDNLLFGSNPDSGIVEVSKFVESPNQQKDETHENSENESNENKSNESKSRVDLADEKEQNPQPELSKFEFCTCCGSDDIQVTGNQFYCGECDVTYEVTPKGTKVVSTNPVQVVDDLENRVEQLENDVDKINDNSDKDGNSGVLFSLFGIDFGFVGGDEDEDDEDLVSVGAGENPGSDDDDDEPPDGFITW